ncbi:MAG: HAD family hydrolase [Firmicutes bacterium]|nr:HAD family hydrolase [Bacillota bacterium]
MLKAVTFDLWNTVIRTKPGEDIDGAVTERLAGVLEQCGYERPKAKITEATIECRNKVLDLQVNEGREMPPKEQVTWILAALDISASAELRADFYKAYTTVTLEQLPEPIPGVARVLAQLQETLDLALICNTGKTPGSVARIILERLGLKKYFTHLIFSDEVGVAKPHPKIFEQTLAALAVRPEQTVHIGDDPRTDVRGARNIGMHTAWLAHGRDSGGVKCDLIVHEWKDFLGWVQERVTR